MWIGVNVTAVEISKKNDDGFALARASSFKTFRRANRQEWCGFQRCIDYVYGVYRLQKKIDV